MIRDCRVFYDWSPASDGCAALLMLHGWGCDHTVFAPIQKDLQGDMSLLTLDFPGHGASGEPPVPWGVDEYADMTAELLGQLSLTKVDIVAHSFGARVALKLAATSPGLVGRLIITGGAGIRKPLTPKQQHRQNRFKRMNAVLTRLGSLKLLRPLIARLQASLRTRYGSADYVKLDEVMRRTFSKVISEDLQPLLSAVQSPTLLIWGEYDTETPLWMGHMMEEQISDAALIVFEGRSHFAFVEEPRRFLIIVRQFLMGGREV